MFLLKNGRGNPDFLMTGAALTLAVVLLKVLAAGVVVGRVQLGGIDAALVGALLTPTFLAYTAKRIGVDRPAGSK